MINILLVGEYFSSNLGDPLLCRTVENILLEEIKDANIIPLDLSGKISMTQYYSIKKRSRLQKLLVKSSKRLDKIYQLFPMYRVMKTCWHRDLRIWSQMDEILKKNKIDIVIFAGGELFTDYFIGAMYLIVRKVKNAKIIFHACGMHNLSRESIYLSKKILKKKNVCSISLRDSYERFCRLFPVGNKTIETYDTALLCSTYFKETEKKIADYGIGVIYIENVYEFQKKLIRYFMESDLNWKIITNGAERDFECAKKILQELGVSEGDWKKYLQPRPKTARELVEDVTSFKYIISFRMHSQITAASFGIPTFGFVWDVKLVEFYNKLGMEHNYAFLDEDIKMEEIFEALDLNSKELCKIAKEQGVKSKAVLVSSVRKALNLEE